MGYSRKNPNSRVENMEFPGELKKKQVEFPGMIKKKSCGISGGLGFRSLNF